jgi:hypothetical protein
MNKYKAVPTWPGMFGGGLINEHLPKNTSMRIQPKLILMDWFTTGIAKGIGPGIAPGTFKLLEI